MFKVNKRTPLTDSIMRFCSEEDIHGRKGMPGMIRLEAPVSYLSLYEFESEAKEYGLTIEEYLKQWWMEVSEDMTFQWEWNEHTCKGELILELGRVKFYDLYGQLIIETEGYRSEDVDFEYFQPEIKVEGQWRCPICSFQAFETFEEARAFLEEEGLDIFETKIERYADQEIEKVSIIDRYRKRLR